jgi:hypothetical protein
MCLQGPIAPEEPRAKGFHQVVVFSTSISHFRGWIVRLALFPLGEFAYFSNWTCIISFINPFDDLRRLRSLSCTAPAGLFSTLFYLDRTARKPN